MDTNMIVFETDDIIDDKYKIDFLLEQCQNAMYYVVTDIAGEIDLQSQFILKIMGSKQDLQYEIRKVRRNLISIEQSIVLTKSTIVKKSLEANKELMEDVKKFLPKITYDGNSCYCLIQLEKYLLLDYLERYKKAGKTLKHIDAILQVAQQILLSLEQIHEAGYTYNYLQLNCIMVTEKGHVVFNDFSQLQPLDDNLDRKNVEKLPEDNSRQMNYMFGSINHLLELPSCRKDDIIQLFYLMIYLLCGQQFIGHKGLIMNMQNRMTPHGQCQEFLLQDILQYRAKFDLQEMTMQLVDVIELIPNKLNSWSQALNEKILSQEQEFFDLIQGIAQTIDSKKDGEIPNYVKIYDLLSSLRHCLRKIKYTTAECQEYRDNILQQYVEDQKNKKKKYKLTTLRQYQMAVRLVQNDGDLAM